MSTILHRINERKLEEVRERRAHVSQSDLLAVAEAQDAPRGFLSALKSKLAAHKPAVIAEVKKASPSRGVIRANFDPAAIAKSYQAGGAACLSVLTDHDYFQGHEDYLVQARAACDLPVLRKDFLIDPYQITEARAIGADAVLLIVASLDPYQLHDLHQQAGSLSLDVLVEVHSNDELEIALAIGADLIGINNRDLRSFETRLQTTFDLLPLVPGSVTLVTESGINDPHHVAQMRARGVESFLIGETPMRAEDPGAELQRLFDGAL